MLWVVVDRMTSQPPLCTSCSDQNADAQLVHPQFGACVYVCMYIYMRMCVCMFDVFYCLMMTTQF